MVVEIFSAIIAVVKAIPAITELVDKFYEEYTLSKIDNIMDGVVTIKEERSVLLNQINKAKTNEERRILSITLKRIG